MSFYCGFFNSINKDRLYTAEDMNMPYKRIVSNGVFAKPNGESSTDFQVLANGNMEVAVQPGNGIFKDKWAENTTRQVLTIPTSHTLLNRIDSVVVKIDNTDDVRGGSIILKSGEYAETPTAPTLINESGIKEYRLANIYVGANVETITQENITDTRPTAECGWVTNLLWDSDITATYRQWEAQFQNWFSKAKQEASTLTGDVTWFSDETETTEKTKVVIFNGISNYDESTDLLMVYVNGFKISKYTAEFNENLTITFELDLNAGASVECVILHKIKKSEV